MKTAEGLEKVMDYLEGKVVSGMELSEALEISECLSILGSIASQEQLPESNLPESKSVMSEDNINIQIEKYRGVEITDKQWDKLVGDIIPGSAVDIYWTGLGNEPDGGYLFSLPNQAPDEGDIMVHVPHPQNPDGMDEGWPQWVHLVSLLKNKRVKRIVCTALQKSQSPKVQEQPMSIDIYNNALNFIKDKNISSEADRGYIARWIQQFYLKYAHQSKAQPKVTDEMICNYFPIGAYADQEWSIKQIYRREGAKALRDGLIPDPTRCTSKDLEDAG